MPATTPMSATRAALRPDLKSADEALSFIAKAVEKASGYRIGEDVTFALDPASTEFFKDGKYHLEGEGKVLDSEGIVRYYADLCARYPIASIEDGCAEDDWDTWKLLTDTLGKQRSSWSATTCSSPIRSVCAAASNSVRPMPS